MDRTGALIRFENRKHDRFFAEVRHAANAYLDTQPRGRFAPPSIWFKFAALGLLGAAAYAGILASPAAFGALTACYLVFGITCLLLVINVSHDAAHNALSRHGWVNRLTHGILFNLLGVNAYLWKLRHNGSHHVFPNVNGSDADIDDNPFVRLSPNHPRRPHQRWQHLYAVAIYALMHLHAVFVQDFIYIFKKRIANIVIARHPTSEYVVFFCAKAAHVTIMLGLPLLLVDQPWTSVVGAYLIMSAVTSWLFLILLVGTHFAEEAAFPVVSAESTLPRSWAAHALATSLDWHTDSRLGIALAGGVNCHGAHHLFPGVSHAHYRALTRIVHAAAQRHGVRYNVTTFAGMIGSHFRLLKRLGTGVTHVRPRHRPQALRFIRRHVLQTA